VLTCSTWQASLSKVLCPQLTVKQHLPTTRHTDRWDCQARPRSHSQLYPSATVHIRNIHLLQRGAAAGICSLTEHLLPWPWCSILYFFFFNITIVFKTPPPNIFCPLSNVIPQRHCSSADWLSCAQCQVLQSYMEHARTCPSWQGPASTSPHSTFLQHSEAWLCSVAGNALLVTVTILQDSQNRPQSHCFFSKHNQEKKYAITKKIEIQIKVMKQDTNLAANCKVCLTFTTSSCTHRPAWRTHVAHVSLKVYQKGK